MSAVAEQLVLIEITGRLVRDFPATSRAEVDVAVRQVYARFELCPIRDFVPLFVEKHACGDVRQRYSAVTL